MYYKKRTCAYCGKEFYATAPSQKYCSLTCKREAQKLRRKRYRQNRVKRGRSPKPKPGDKCLRCGYDIPYALEYSHEVNGFLCANCHRLLHPGSSRRMTDAFGGYPVRLISALYDPGGLYEPLRCYLCEQPIFPAIWERHHMIPRARGGSWLGTDNIVIICANCHRILTRAERIIQEYFEKFLTTERNPYYPHYTTLEMFNKLSPVIQLGIVRGFYHYLKENWNEILNRLRPRRQPSLEDFF